MSLPEQLQQSDRLIWATPAIVPTPNSYSRRICSNKSTLALQSNESPPLRAWPESEYLFVYRVGQNKPPKWTNFSCQTQLSLRNISEAASERVAR